MSFVLCAVLVLTLLFVCAPARACTTVIVGRKASSDGSRIAGRTDDAGKLVGMQLQTVAARAGEGSWIFEDERNGLRAELPVRGCGYVMTPVFPSYRAGIKAESCVNEYGVCLSATETIFANDLALAADPLIESGVAESNIPTLVIPYVRSAREGVRLLGQMVERYGSAEGSGVIFADERETWYMEIYTGHQWAAVRAPEDCYAVIGNDALLGFADPADEENVIACESIWSLPREKGFLRELDGRPHLSLSYGAPLRDYSQIRVWAGRRLFSPSTAGEYDVNRRYEPFARPDHPLGLQEVMELTRYRFEDCKYSADIPGNTTRPIGIERAAQCHLFQLRDGKPTVFWLLMANSEFSVYLPLYGNLSSVPESYLADSAVYTPDSAYWRFRALSSLCTLDREKYGAPVRAFWREKESALIRGLPEMDAAYEAAGRSPEAAAALFDAVAEAALREAQELFFGALTRLSEDLVRKTGIYAYDAPEK